jgi:ISXO2-like transposase domain
METSAYDGPLGGPNAPVEIDESFVGGDPKNFHKARREKMRRESRPERVQEYQNRFTHKTAVVGMLDRESRQIRAKVVPNVKRDTLQKEILSTISTRLEGLHRSSRRLHLSPEAIHSRDGQSCDGICSRRSPH